MERAEIEKIANSFKIRSSATYDICLGTIGLTDKQAIRLNELQERYKGVGKPLTANMELERLELHKKHSNPELPETAKTYCKKWLKEHLYGRRKDIKSKYIDKGNICEEDGFTLMCLELNLGMVYKNTKLHSNEYMQGTDDLFVNNIVYDNKSSWDLDTFPMFETEVPNEAYEWQLNSYAELRNVDNAVLAYTLIDAPLELIEPEIKWLADHNDIYKRVCQMVYTKEYFDTLKNNLFPGATLNTFVEIPAERRVKPFPIKRDPAKIETIKQRVPMCREYIKTLLISLITNN